MAIKKIHTVIAVLGIGLLGGGAWYWQNKGPGSGGISVAGAASAPKGPAAGPGAPGAPGGPAGAGRGHRG